MDTLSDGFRISSQVSLQAPEDSGEQLVYAEQIRLSRSLRLRELRARMSGYAGTELFTVTPASDTTFSIQLDSPDAPKQAVTGAGPVDLIPRVALPFRVAFAGGLRVGRTTTPAVFDPVVVRVVQPSVRVTGDSTWIVVDSAAYDSAAQRWRPAGYDTLRAWRLHQVERGVPTDTWIDADGHVVARRTGLGVTFERTAFEIARHDRSPGEMPRSMSAEHVAQLADSFAADPLLSDSAARARALEDAPLLQFGDSAIQRVAARLAGRPAPPGRIAVAIARWVSREVALTPFTGLRTAPTVMHERHGSEDQRVSVFVALARASGIPTRSVAGVVARNGAWAPGAWAEVWTGSGWETVDLAAGTVPAEGSRIGLTRGGLVHPLDLMLIAGGAIDALTAPVR